MIKLDYSLQTPEERNNLVQQILEDNPNPNEKYLEILADYLILCMEKQEKKEKKLLTENRLTTINKRETSFENLVSQFENGEDGIYNLINQDKQTIFQPKVKITKKDLEEIPPLKQLREAIDCWAEKLKTVEGKDAFTMKKALIEMRKDQYIIKDSYRQPLSASKLTKSNIQIKLPDKTSQFDEEGFPIPDGITLISPKICSLILCDYAKLKEQCYDALDSDLWCLMLDFDKISKIALKDHPMYERIVELKIDKLQNTQIQSILLEEFGITHSLEYISSLWRNKIPKMIAAAAEDEYLGWYYREVERGKWKRCSRCGQIKLAHNKYFSKNKTSKDGFYSICKECRNKRKEV